MRPDCTEECFCPGPLMALSCELLVCHTDGPCDLRDGLYDCFCNVGYAGDGKQCDGRSSYLFIEYMPCAFSAQMQVLMYSTNHVYLHRPNAFGFWQPRLHLCYETLKHVSELA